MSRRWRMDSEPYDFVQRSGRDLGERDIDVPHRHVMEYAANTPQTFYAGQPIPFSVPSVTFSVVGSWTDNIAINETATVGRPGNCSDTTTTSSTTITTTTTTTLPGETTTTQPGSTTTTTDAGDLAVTAITPICVRDAPYVTSRSATSRSSTAARPR